MQTTRTCTNCHGTGKVITNPCETCKGKGTVRKQVRLTVKIPAGVDDGQTIVMQGEGEPGTNGGPKGDLYILIHVKNIAFIVEKEIMYFVKYQLHLHKQLLVQN